MALIFGRSLRVIITLNIIQKKFALSFHANAWVVHGLDNNDDVSGKLPVIKSFFCGFLFLDSIWTIPWSVSLFFSTIMVHFMRLHKKLMKWDTFVWQEMSQQSHFHLLPTFETFCDLDHQHEGDTYGIRWIFHRELDTKKSIECQLMPLVKKKSREIWGFIYHIHTINQKLSKLIAIPQPTWLNPRNQSEKSLFLFSL